MVFPFTKQKRPVETSLFIGGAGEDRTHQGFYTRLFSRQLPSPAIGLLLHFGDPGGIRTPKTLLLRQIRIPGSVTGPSMSTSIHYTLIPVKLLLSSAQTLPSTYNKEYVHHLQPLSELLSSAFLVRVLLLQAYQKDMLESRNHL